MVVNFLRTRLRELRHRSVARALVLLATIVSSAACAQNVPSGIVDQIRKSTVFISVDDARQDGVVGQRTGSGFVIHKDGYVLTAGHVIPQSTQLRVSGAMQSRAGSLESMDVIARDPSFDFVLLKFRNTAINREPVKLGTAAAIRDGEPLGAIGFPLGTEFGVKFGTLVGRGGPGGAWITNIALNPGDSGGPVFTSNGNVVAMTTGALDGAEGIKFILPLSYASYLLKIANVDFGQPASAAPQSITYLYRVDRTLESAGGMSPSSEKFMLRFPARAGYKISDANIVRKSENKLSDIDLRVSPSGDEVTLGFRLTSGPVYDRWRGWLDADIVTTQVPQ